MNDQPDTTTPLDEYGAGLADRLGGTAVVEFDTVRIYVDREAWVETIRRARDEEGLTFFSWLSGIDWSKDCLLYTSDAADDLTRVDLGGRRIIKQNKNK